MVEARKSALVLFEGRQRETGERTMSAVVSVEGVGDEDRLSLGGMEGKGVLELDSREGGRGSRKDESL